MNHLDKVFADVMKSRPHIWCNDYGWHNKNECPNEMSDNATTD